MPQHRPGNWPLPATGGLVVLNVVLLLALFARQPRFRLPADPDRVHAPGGRRSVPCSAGLVDLAGLGDDGAAALCRDGRLRTTDDGGRWATVLKDSACRALNADDTESVVAREVPSCSGLAVQRFAVDGGGLDNASPRCRREANPDKPVTVPIDPSTTWLWSGDDVEFF